MRSSFQPGEVNPLQRFSRFALFVTACLALVLVAMPALATKMQVLEGHVPQAAVSSRAIREVSRGTRLNLAIGLPLRNQTQLDALLVQLADPKSPNYRKFLTPAQFTAKFGPTEQDYQAVIRFARANGLVVTGTHSNRMLLDVAGEVSAVEKVFNVKMLVYNHPTRGDFYAPDTNPTLYLDTQMLSVSGLDNFVKPQPMGLKKAALDSVTPYVTGSGPAGYFIGKDFRAAYAPDIALTGMGQTVGLLEFDGFYAADVASNAARAGMTAVPTQTVLLDGFNGAPGSSNIEVILDIMMAQYMAPGLSRIIVYEGYYPNDVLNRMATDNLAQQLSSSWGFGIDATTEQIFKQYIAQGQSLLQASGDSGAYMNGVMTPSDDPNLTVVGGTSLTTAGTGGAWSSESTWTGSGGGISTVYPIPTWQQGVSMATNGGSTTKRNLPDVGLTADIQMYLIYNNGQQTAVGGTSAAAPLWAGFIALTNQQALANAKVRVGFLNPLIYAIGKSANYATDFHDIKQGTNTGFSATTGYDLTTGWGSPAGQHLINDLTGTTASASFALSSSASALSIKPSSTSTATVTVAALNGFKSSVNLAVSGLPSGVTAAFSPTSTSTTSTVTFTAGATAVAGTYPLTITGTSGTLSSTTAIALTVVVPSFSITASASSLTVPRGSSKGSTITVSGQNGFAGNVSLVASGLPSGVTAAFSPASTTSTSTVTITVSSTAVAGTYPVTVTGTSGTLTSTATIAVSVVVPSFSLATSGTSLIIPRSSSKGATITVNGLNGFTGSVTLAASGLPSGVTAAFSPASTASASTVTFSAGATAVAGSYPVTITGISGTLSSTTTIAVSVVIPSFSLATSAASLTVPRSSSMGAMISVSGQNGFAGLVTLAASGLASGVTAVFSPASTSTTSTVTFAASSTAVAGTYPVTVTGTSGTLKSTTTIAVTVVVPNFTLSFQPGNVGVPRGLTASGTLTLTSQNGFSGVATLTASGLPSGVTAGFGATSASGTRQVTLTASSTAPVGSFPITLIGVSGSLTKTTSFTLTVLAPPVGTSLVNLSSLYNVNALVTDGLPFAGGGLDGGLNGSSTAYSANLVGVQQTIGGSVFYFGSANTLDAVSAKTVSLPSGQFSSIKLLATGVNGSQPLQVFKVTYTDGTVSTFTQSVSDWFSPQNFSGETKAMTMAYRNNAAAQRDNRTFYMYEYVFTLNAAKTVASITLPSNRNVVVLAADLTSASSAVK